jgi:hypothetical protein
MGSENWGVAECGYDSWTDITTVGAFRETPLQNSYIRSATPKMDMCERSLPYRDETKPPVDRTDRSLHQGQLSDE